MRSILAGLLTLSMVVLSGAATCRGADYEPGTPSSYLFDTRTPSDEPLKNAQLAAKSGWQVVPEDTLAHKFQGDIVVLNDRLAVVLRAKGAGGEVYCQTPAELKKRAVLAPIGASGSAAASLSGVQIIENNPGAVMIEAAFKMADGVACSLKYRLTAGQISVETRPGDGAAKLAVRLQSRYAVVPDFFGDDMVFSAAGWPRSRLALPTENFLLNLLDGGNAMAMCVWQSNRQNAEAAIAGEGTRRAIDGCEIECMKDKNIWVAFIEGSHIWHERPISADEAKAEMTLDWKPPFAAKWRADWLHGDGPAQSWLFQKTGESDEAVPAAAGVCPCRLEGDRALVQLQSAGLVVPAAPKAAKSLLVYAMDRSRATPLTAFCPIDVLRSTLGVGPCQYILQTEGLGSDANPTPDSVMSFVEKQFSRKKEKKGAEEIQGMLKQMLDLMDQTQARIGAYAELADAVRATCKAESPKSEAAPAAETLGRIADRMQQAAAAASTQPSVTGRAARLAGNVNALIGKDNALAECQRLGAELRDLGTLQDRTLAKCRMDARWLKQQAAMIAADNAPAAALAKKIQTRAEQILQR